MRECFASGRRCCGCRSFAGDIYDTGPVIVAVPFSSVAVHAGAFPEPNSVNVPSELRSRLRSREAAVDLAKRAVRMLGYLWGGVDFLEDTNGTCYVLEVNSAPGMDDTTAQAYADAIKKYAEQSNQHVAGGNPRQP